MLRYLTTRMVSIFSNYFISYTTTLSVSSYSMVRVLTSDTGQRRILCLTTISHDISLSHQQRILKHFSTFLWGKGRVILVRDPNYLGDRNFMVVRSCLMSGCHLDIEYHKSPTQLTQLTDHGRLSRVVCYYRSPRQTDRCPGGVLVVSWCQH